jgi:hypothetical protein
MAIALNAIAFQLAWFACVLGAAYGSPWIGISVTIAVIALHLSRASDNASELKLILMAGLVGIVGEGALIASGIVSYVAPGPIPLLPPFWLITLWLGFATLMNVSMAWMKNRYALAAILGLLFGPLSYIAGEKLGGMTIHEPRMIGIASISIMWAIAMPVLVKLGETWNGYRRQ